MLMAIRSELRKFFTTRMWWGMAIGVFVAGAAFAGLFAVVLTSDSASLGAGGPGGAPTGDATQIANSVYTGGLQIGYLLLLTIGVLQIGSEYRHKTISSTLLSTPKRLTAMLAKVVALLVIGALYGVVNLVGSAAVGSTVLTLRGADAFPSADVARALALSLLVLGLWALIGLGVGILIPNQVAALLIGVGVAWIVEPLAGFLLSFWSWGAEHIVKFMPSQATGAIVNGVTDGTGAARLDWWAAALVLALYAALLSGFGIWRVVRSDIS
jgi:ABC-2 type transport system permease protein